MDNLQRAGKAADWRHTVLPIEHDSAEIGEEPEGGQGRKGRAGDAGRNLLGYYRRRRLDRIFHYGSCCRRSVAAIGLNSDGSRGSYFARCVNRRRCWGRFRFSMGAALAISTC